MLGLLQIVFIILLSQGGNNELLGHIMVFGFRCAFHNAVDSRHSTYAMQENQREKFRTPKITTDMRHNWRTSDRTASYFSRRAGTILDRTW